MAPRQELAQKPALVVSLQVEVVAAVEVAVADGLHDVVLLDAVAGLKVVSRIIKRTQKVFCLTFWVLLILMHPLFIGFIELLFIALSSSHRFL